jgi:hypothetical protein
LQLVATVAGLSETGDQPAIEMHNGRTSHEVRPFFCCAAPFAATALYHNIAEPFRLGVSLPAEPAGLFIVFECQSLD